MKTIKPLLLLVTIILLSACGSKLDGTYADEYGMMNYTFKSNGKVIQSAIGMEMEMKYEVEGDKVKILMPQGVNMVFTMQDNETIQGPMGIKLKKQK